MKLSLWPRTAAGVSWRCRSHSILVKRTLIVNACLPSPLLLIFNSAQSIKGSFILTGMQRIQNTWDQKDFALQDISRAIVALEGHLKALEGWPR